MSAGDIFGEMTCMSFYPRSATVRAAEDCTVLEMLRNVLYIMQRSPSFRRELEAKYRAAHDRRPPAQRSPVRPFARRRGPVPPDRRRACARGSRSSGASRAR